MQSKNNEEVAEDTIKIRHLRAEDIPHLQEIDRKITQRSTTWDNVDIYLAGGPLLSFIAELNGEVIGFLLGDVKSYEFGLAQSAWIETIGVSPDHQRDGVGRMLVSAFLDHCRRSNISNVQVLVRQDDRALHGFLDAMSFHRGEMVNFQKLL